jgi:hypothetical protein
MTLSSAARWTSGPRCARSGEERIEAREAALILSRTGRFRDRAGGGGPRARPGTVPRIQPGPPRPGRPRPAWTSTAVSLPVSTAGRTCPVTPPTRCGSVASRPRHARSRSPASTRSSSRPARRGPRGRGRTTAARTARLSRSGTSPAVRVSGTRGRPGSPGPSTPELPRRPGTSSCSSTATRRSNRPTRGRLPPSTRGRLGVAKEPRLPWRRAAVERGRCSTEFWLFLQASGLPPLLGSSRAIGFAADATAGGRSTAPAPLAIRRDVWLRCGPLDLPLTRRTSTSPEGREGWWEVACCPAGGRPPRGDRHAGRLGGIRMDLGLLWRDLLVWAERWRGERWANRCRRALLAGSGLRLLARRLASPLRPSERRLEWKRDTEALAAARRAHASRSARS